jgi:hypothetical protein
MPMTPARRRANPIGRQVRHRVETGSVGGYTALDAIQTRIEERLMGGTAYKIGLATSTLALVSAAVLICMALAAFLPGSETTQEAVAWRADTLSESSDVDPVWSMVQVGMIASLVLLISAIGTAAAVIFGWRGERRQAEVLRRRITQLEAEIGELDGRAGKST